MNRQKQDKIIVSLDGKAVQGDKLKKLFAFCFSISDQACLSTIAPGHRTQEETIVLMNQYIEKQCNQAERVSKDDLEVIMEDFEERRDAEKQHLLKTEEEKQAWLATYLGEYKLIKREVSDRNHCTRGSCPVVNYYFKLTPELQHHFEAQEDIYSYMVFKDKKKFLLEDPGFYYNDENVVSICSHEGLAHLVLTREQYEQFRALRIPYGFEANPYFEMSEKEWLKECAYQEREEYVRHYYKEDCVPEEIGAITSLKTLEIFGYWIKKLPQSLENLTELECLRITGNQVETLDFDLSKLTQLKILDFGGMPLKTFPKEILQLTQLKYVYLNGIQESDIPDEIVELTQLKVLALPEEAYTKGSEDKKAFLRALKPKLRGTPLREILGEEKMLQLLKDGSSIIMNIPE